MASVRKSNSAQSRSIEGTERERRDRFYEGAVSTNEHSLLDVSIDNGVAEGCTERAIETVRRGRGIASSRAALWSEEILHSGGDTFAEMTT